MPKNDVLICPRQKDSDGDGKACDGCPYGPLNEVDSDTVCGDVDNCPTTSNIGQADADSDGVGDACDPCINDQLNDIDSDAICGSVYLRPSDPDNDIDSDAICVGAGFNPPMVGDSDNCPTTTSLDQTDSDSDGRANPCDATQGVAVLGRLTVTGIADRMSSAGYIMNVASAQVAGSAGVCPAGTTARLGFWSFKGPARVPVFSTVGKTFNGGSGQYDVELAWSGRSAQFEVYRKNAPFVLVNSDNLWQTTNLCDSTDQTADSFDILFYSVIE
jgi:hypothetical protein